ncbi:MAG: DinB family protein [Planctomycetota bacterium]
MNAGGTTSSRPAGPGSEGARGDKTPDAIGPNVEILRRTRELIERLTDVQYRHVEGGLSESTIGQHVRHVLDHYRLFLAGLDAGDVDYDARQRHTAVETTPAAALELVDELIEGLGALGADALGRTLRIHQQGSYEAGRFDGCESRADRELLFLQSHTVHHQALIAVLARAQGLDVPSTFGMAPSTVAWLARSGADGPSD